MLMTIPVHVCGVPGGMLLLLLLLRNAMRMLPCHRIETLKRAIRARHADVHTCACACRTCTLIVCRAAAVHIAARGTGMR